MSGLYSFTLAVWSEVQNGFAHWWRPAASVSLAVLAVYWACFRIYRVYFSPLSNIPGPKLAALTYLYEGYYEVWLGGKYFLKVAELHKQYGPIVRITPEEVHFADPEFLDALYPAGRRKTEKPSWFALLTGTPYSIVSTTHHELHRQRRNALSSFFSAASIHRFEHIMRQHLAKLLSRLDESARTNSIVKIHEVFKAAASDIITMYAFDNSFDFLDMPDYGQSYFESTNNFFLLTHVCVILPWLYPLIQNSPGWLLRSLFPGLSEVRDRQTWWLDQVHSIRKSPDLQRVKHTIFGGILTSKLPDEEKSDARLASEAQLVVFAGEGTTAWGLNAALYELLAHPDELRKLKAELSGVDVGEDGIPALSQVEGLLYLGAVIQEALRVHPGVLTRQMRVSPDVPVTYVDSAKGKTYVVPPGAVTSMSPHITHRDPDAFEDPYEFRPQRWIDNPKLARYFHGFARGSRNCVGMTLARREMALILATLILKYDLYTGQKGPTMELYDTKRARDVDAHSDYIIPVPAEGSQGVRILFRA
ncbi:Uu.00g024530.m01.CDS01 [Anthostomella pinea]|uniref:Uu.00g024530.m01.CDS01 n=1 Tax=Anthostomella pinea TaxID=933095 RepID=A0AAI8W082_9PEZI|nr:Uu.00g024530.m01.CDS01 [Anthostomella pinea]